jgi:hypothetical protein
LSCYNRLAQKGLKELLLFRGVAQLGLARLLWEQEVPSSNLGAPTINAAPVAQSDRASAF